MEINILRKFWRCYSKGFNRLTFICIILNAIFKFLLEILREVSSDLIFTAFVEASYFAQALRKLMHFFRFLYIHAVLQFLN
ncbi:unnamed protein product [Blepharisma stoltei]|uniref:Uncharacterized protein n=1 Tax=Blepharisma stoltei TaxID=1481888 RepID=A0AAU9J9Z0_9CILI|nr:unnamed protein product [Blepharisma stoltei]